MEDYKISKVFEMGSDKALVVIIPKAYAQKLQIERGTYLRVMPEEGRLILSPLEAPA